MEHRTRAGSENVSWTPRSSNCMFTERLQLLHHRHETNCSCPCVMMLHYTSLHTLQITQTFPLVLKENKSSQRGRIVGVERVSSSNGLTIRGFLSDQGLAVAVAINRKHRDLITCLRGETLQNSVCDVSSYGLFSCFLSEQGLPSDSVLANVTGGRGPRHSETGVGDVAGHQVFG